MPRSYYTYIMASRSRVLYTGITNNIVTRNKQHKAHKPGTFTGQHRCTRLVWYEIYVTPSAAIAREKEIKGWTRARKIALIEETNPRWHDLSEPWDRVPRFGDDTNPPLTRTTIFHAPRNR